MANMADGLEDVISFAIGEPDFITPENIIEAGVTALRNGATHYTPNVGYTPLREAIRDDYNRRGFDYKLENIMVTVGAMESLYLSMLAILDLRDEIIISDPHFTNYYGMAVQCGAVPVLVTVLEENGFMYDIDKLRKAVTNKTKVIIVNSPSNPTGGVASAENLKAIAELAIEKDLYVISDEMYKYLNYTGEEYVSIASFPGMIERTIVIDGLSKSHAMTGWRVGYTAGPENVVAAMTKMQENVVSSVTTVSQFAAVEAITGSQEVRDSMIKEYKKRRDLVVRLINGIDNISCEEPKGAFYAFINIKKTGLSSEEFAVKLLKEQHVIVVPGNGFGPGGEGFVRLSYATSKENIIKGLSKMGKFVAGLS
ncbi:pyridoxal phosphate-dependent aminotransferase [Clostridium sp. FP2]|uniref:pyridoxal phosphate-dependent aminotransferase n=1 Tax=Clostridium sp. FP2 TaxID=2724481 RepID=UPI0013E97195|nr:pyridoxal phosphate-dependent aminotransferase [Clostridium sp. FP2]MBZ9626011.1 pyridoxal phosphate-dependent aminotransferase [Clostridium sp. FP2]